LKSRDIVVGLEIDGTSRAYPWEMLVKQSPVVDRVHGTPLVLVVAPDHKSFRVFISRIDGKDAEFFLKGEAESDATLKSSADVPPSRPEPAERASGRRTGATEAASASSPKSWSLVDTATAGEWNFQGCAVSGTAQGKCLERVPALKDYWFDWRNYHPDTTIYKR
jgi:hypothetical protein